MVTTASSAIFSHPPAARRLIASDPDASGEVTAIVIHPTDARLIAILEAPLAAGETAHDGFRRKERELGDAFAALTVLEARAIHARLVNPRPEDRLAASFGRLAVDRRTRLVMFLADARRREAIAIGRR